MLSPRGWVGARVMGRERKEEEQGKENGSGPSLIAFTPLLIERCPIAALSWSKANPSIVPHCLLDRGKSMIQGGIK